MRPLTVPPPGLAVVRPAPRPYARMQLVCLGYCGGGTAPFRPWGRGAGLDVEVALVCYPGREGRYTTPFARDWDALLDDVTAAVRPLLRRPYVLFGHSMGARVAFELTARLEREGAPAPRELVVSAADAPTRWKTERDAAPRAGDGDARLLAWIRDVGQVDAEVLEVAELRKMTLELLRADLRVSDSYRYVPGVRVGTPLRVLYGAADPTVDAAAAERWRPLAAGRFGVEELPGGHFYTDEVWQRLPERLLPS